MLWRQGELLHHSTIASNLFWEVLLLNLSVSRTMCGFQFLLTFRKSASVTGPWRTTNLLRWTVVSWSLWPTWWPSPTSLSREWKSIKSVCLKYMHVVAVCNVLYTTPTNLVFVAATLLLRTNIWRHKHIPLFTDFQATIHTVNPTPL